MAIKVEYVKTGIANNFGDVIELHEDLKKYPELHHAILKHELGHTSNPKFNSVDFAHDMMPSKVKMIPMAKFIITHPSSWLQFLPIYYTKKWGWVYDKNLMLIYGLVILLMLIGVGLGLLL